MIKYIGDVLLTGHSLYAHHLWFIYSLAIITWVWSLATKKILLGIWILFSSCVVLSFLEWISRSFISPNNIPINSLLTWILGGGLPIFSGALFYYYSNKINRIRSYILAIFCIISSLIFYSLKFPFWPFLGGVALFIISYQIRPVLNLSYLILRKESMWIYYLHMYVIMMTMVIIRQFHISSSRVFLLLYICGITWYISKGITRLCTLSKFKFLEELIK